MRVVQRSNEAVLAAVEEWIELLADDRYQEAFERLDPNGQYEWTPELIRNTAAGYGDPCGHTNDGVSHRVTSVANARESKTPVYRDVEWHGKPIRGFIGVVHHDIPLDGEWSDLTAIFLVREVKGGVSLVLDQLHVL